MGSRLVSPNPILPAPGTPRDRSLNQAITDMYRVIQRRLADEIQSDVFSKRPTSNGSLRFFYATDTLRLYFDTVGGWVLVGTGGGGGPAFVPTGTGFVHITAGSEDAASKLVDTADINNDQVTDAKLRNSAALSVIGRSVNSTGDPADIAAASDGDVLRRSGTALGFGTIVTAGIADGAITFAKMANLTTQRVVGRNTAGSGVPEEVTASSVLDWIGSTRGSILYRGASGWAILAPGTSGYALKSNGAGADPSYGAVTVSTPTGTGLRHVTAGVEDAAALAASAASILHGRGSAGGAGDFQEITLGANLTMTGTVLAAATPPAYGKTSYGAFSALPGGSDGDHYYSTDGWYHSIYQSGAWHHFVEGTSFEVTRFVDSGWSDDNPSSGGATASYSFVGGAYEAAVPSTGGNQYLRARYKTHGLSTPWTLTIVIVPQFPYGFNNAGAVSIPSLSLGGLAFRQASSGKYQSFMLWYTAEANYQLNNTKWTNSTTISTAYRNVQFGTNQVGLRPIWLRIGDDGTSRICSISQDGGKTWGVQHVVARTDFLTADQFAICYMCRDGSNGVDIGTRFRYLHLATG